MASIVKKTKKGRPYYYAVQSRRVNGKPRIVWQKYLGTIDAIIERADGARPPRPKEAVLFEAGAVGALLGIAQRLGVVELIDSLVPKRDQGPTVGQYMLLAALNRAVAPCSKVAIGQWYEQTVLRRLWGFDKRVFSSPRFWDHMDRMNEDAIDAFQDQLIPRLREHVGLDEEILLYDTTNFFTFLASTNDRCTVAQRGINKAKRHDLRQIGLAVLSTRDFHIPLFHHMYPGNVPDVSLFPQLAGQLLRRHRHGGGAAQRATLVFDKGNISDDAMEQLIVAGRHFVLALPVHRFPELLGTPLVKFEPVEGMPGTRAYSAPVQIWGKTCQAVVSYTESFFTQQLVGVTQNMAKCQKKLLEREKALRKWRQGKGRGKKPTVAGLKKSVASVLSAQFMKELFHTHVDQHEGLPRMHYELNHQALDQLTHQRLGRTLLITDHVDWSAYNTIDAYRSLTAIEDAFRDMKNIDFLHWQPGFHWTNQKLAVHAFYCVLALQLATVARKTATQAGIDLSLPALLKELSAIREVAVIYPQGTLAHRKDHVTLSRMSPRQRKLAECLRIGEAIRG